VKYEEKKVEEERKRKEKKNENTRNKIVGGTPDRAVSRVERRR